MATSQPVRRLVQAALLLAAGAAQSAGFDDTAVARFVYPDWFKTTFFDLRDDLADARASGRRGLLLFFSTAGCSYCKQMLEDSFADQRFAERLREHYDVIGLEIFSDSEITDWSGATHTLSSFARTQGVQFSPTLLFLDIEGRRQLRLVGYYDKAFLDDALDYLDGSPVPAVSLRDWRNPGVSTPTAADPAVAATPDPLFAAPPYQLDRRHYPAQRPLLVLFRQNGCVPCSRFHREVLGEPSIREVLQAFDVVGLDADDETAPLVAPDGGVKTPAAWHRELGFSRLPALAVFDEHGEPIVKTDATVLQGRFSKLLGYVQDRAYERGWTFQRYARTESIRQMRERQNAGVEP